MRIILLVLTLLWSMPAWGDSHGRVRTYEYRLTGKAAPDAVLKRTDGPAVGLLAGLHGKKALLVFWATWCPHCYEEMQGIKDSIAPAEQKGIKIVLVDVGESRESVQEYFYRRRMKLSSFVDEDSVLPGLYRLQGVPTLVFIDEKGVVKAMTHAFPADYEDYFTGA